MSERTKNFPGTPVKTKAIREGKIPTVRMRPKVKFAWSAGIAMGRFLDELKNGRIIATTCDKCRRVMVPPRVYCEKCFKPTDGWTYVKDTGTINTFSVSFLARDATRLKEPIIVAIIDLDGASKNMGIIHKLARTRNWKNIRIGMKVQAVWKPAKERTGTVTDIEYLKLIKEEKH